MMSQIPDWYNGVGDGWAAILTILHTELMEVCDLYEADQVKEKFGGLRAYVSCPEGTDEAIKDQVLALELKYEALSYSVCEICGQQGQNQANAHGWYTTLCVLHRAEEEAAVRAHKEGET